MDKFSDLDRIIRENSENELEYDQIWNELDDYWNNRYDFEYLYFKVKKIIVENNL